VTLALLEYELSFIAISEIEFQLPPYDFAYLKRLHHHVFKDIYEWAGEIRTIDITKGNTRFCTASRIEPEVTKVFQAMAHKNWFEGLDRPTLITSVAESFGDLNMVHPFREGNGRTQRLLFEHVIANAGFKTTWWAVEESEWIAANIDAVLCDYTALERIFARVIGAPLKFD